MTFQIDKVLVRKDPFADFNAPAAVPERHPKAADHGAPCGGKLAASRYRAPMGESPLSAQDIRAAAEAHRELGAEYSDAVVESFLARIDDHIEARVEQQLARKSAVRRRQIDPVRLGKYRAAFAGLVAGTVVVGVPLTLSTWTLLGDTGRTHKALVWMWVVIVAVYGLAAYRLRKR
jgi:hypothetical protein